MGGNVEMSLEEPLYKAFIDEVKKVSEGKPKIGIIPSASGNPPRTGKIYSSIFSEFGVETDVIDPLQRKDASDEDLVSLTYESDGFFFSGGNQLRLTSLLGGTKVLEAIRERFMEGAVLAGTSAGAVCMTATMISYGLVENALLSGEIELTQGLNFIDNTIIDTHFSARGRFPRLFHAVAENPGVLGVGLGEDTGIIWDFKEHTFKVIGSGNVVIVDGKQIHHSNVSEVEVGQAISVEGIIVHILIENIVYDFVERNIIH